MPPSLPTELPDPATMTPAQLCNRLEEYEFEAPMMMARMVRLGGEKQLSAFAGESRH